MPAREGRIELCCPRTLLPLREVDLATARQAVGCEQLVARRSPTTPAPFGETERVLLRSDDRVAYPIVDRVPILLGPEQLTHPDADRDEDLRRAVYAEAYEEMAHYNEAASSLTTAITSSPNWIVVDAATRADASTFPEPRREWLDATYDCAAQGDVYRLVAPFVRAGGTVCQVGGKASQVCKLLVAGASEGWLVTPMLDEATYSVQLADATGVGDRFRAVVAVAEEMPFGAGSFDAMVSGGSLHHIQTKEFGGQLSRVLRPGGVFGAWDPWRSPLYKVGTSVFGKREPAVHCQPLEPRRMRDLESTFDGSVELRLHSPIMRYLLIVLWKLKRPIKLETALRIFDAEDRAARRLGPLRRLSSSSAVLLQRPG